MQHDLNPKPQPPTQPNSIRSPHILTPIFPSHSFRPPLSPSLILIIFLHRNIMPDSSESQYIRLEVINGKNLRVPSWRIPAGIYVSINVDLRRRWKLAISVLSSDEFVAWGNIVILSSHFLPVISMEIKASYELGRIPGGGELIGELQMSWDEPFDLSFPLVRGVHPSITLKVAVVHYDDQDSTLFDVNIALCPSLVDFEIAREIDVGHAQFASCDEQDSLSPEWFGRAFSVGSGPVSGVLTWRHYKKSTAADIREAAQLHHELLPLCPKGTYLRSIVAGRNGVNYVINGCNNLPKDAPDEGIHLRSVVLELCPLSHQLRPRTLIELAHAVAACFDQHGSIDDLDMNIRFGHEAVSLHPEGHASHDFYLNNFTCTLASRFRHQGKPSDLDEAISLHEKALRLRLVEHESRLINLGLALVTHFNTRNDFDDINRAISLLREALTLHPPEHPHRDITLNDLALALEIRYNKLYVSEDLNEAIDRCRESLRLKRLDNPEYHRTLLDLSSAFCSRFTQTQKNEDVGEAITLCQESLAALSSLHPDRYFTYMRLQKAYLSRYRIIHDPADLALAIENFRLTSGYPTKGFPNRI
ncbi:uncharacterized protein F5891DRAFT_979165 [Suillus fuscotomentosus]|uniref:Uncharacterized protein n=1 Tax=Suillus fuscotomentosus TaxID=1912939 RepID=A0AAD4EBU6_9AGAM|nr:uncharacterized protein F5891DRAFT_979165 [Suillus fuscotomentosus]KAG1902058.1 hypothetical protein F5891DRAFT_979165 [Suillus fuscotomentosus]